MNLQLPSGETIRGDVPAGLSDDDLKSYVRMKRPDLFGAPAGVSPPPQPNMQQVDITGKPQNPSAGMAGVPGGSSNPTPASDTYAATVGGPFVAASAYATPGLLPFLRATGSAALKAAPYVAASEGINYARQKLPGGKFIPPGAELLPFFMGGGEKGKGAAAEKEAIQAPSADQMPGRPYMPNPRFEPQPEPEPLPQRTGPLFLKGNVEAPSEPTPAQPTNITKLPWNRTLNQALGNEPVNVKPGTPIGKQLPRESSAVASHNYDADAKEFHVTPKSGNTTYIYGDVTPEDAQAFQAAESKGKAWQQMRSNPLVGKVVNGKRVNVKPATDGGDQ